MADLYPYPDEFPQAALSAVLDALRGGEVPRARLVHAAGNLAYYAAGRIVPDGALVGTAGADLSEEQEQLCAEVVRRAEPHAAATAAGAVPWGRLARIALEILGKFLEEAPA